MDRATEERERQLLPVLCFEGKDFIVDIAPRKFRDAKDTTETVSFYSDVGRRMARACADYDFRAYQAVGEA